MERIQEQEEDCMHRCTESIRMLNKEEMDVVVECD
jgi:hypothetical protein